MTMNGPRAVVIGAGFAGLSAAWQLSQFGIRVDLLESSASLGGLASTFEVEGRSVERFYHHWFLSDRAVLDLAEELGLGDRVVVRPTRSAVYGGHKRLRLSTPWDLLRFRPLSWAGRVRLARLMLLARRLRDWSGLESRTAKDWLLELGGEEVYRVVWEPLLKGKFGRHAERISAVWIWNKLKLRGGSRGQRGEEMLAYLSGGFSQMASRLAEGVVAAGGNVHLGTPVQDLRVESGRWHIGSAERSFEADVVLSTIAPPLLPSLARAWAQPSELEAFTRIQYLANLCLVLELDTALSDTYWLSVTDPDFPFVGVIEHTNFEHAADYGGRHILYLSRYLPTEDAWWNLPEAEIFERAWTHLTRMYPQLQRHNLHRFHVWKERWAQPIVEAGYAARIPPERGPWPGFYSASMAQIYPEDRGTNYAVREGRRIARLIASDLGSGG